MENDTWQDALSVQVSGWHAWHAWQKKKEWNRFQELMDDLKNSDNRITYDLTS